MNNDSRLLAADAGWFLTRNLGFVTGLAQTEVESYLRYASAETINSDAESIQNSMHTTADQVQSILVGDIK